MACNLETAKEWWDKYQKAVQLREIDSKQDPENEPYKSKYAARDILNDIKNALTGAESVDEVTNAISAHVEYYLGLIATEVEELSTAEDCLKKSLMLSEGRDSCQSHVLTRILSYSELGVLWSVRGDSKQAVHHLKSSAQLCQKYRAEVGTPPHSPQNLFKLLLKEEPEIGDWKRFEDALTHCVYYLAQAYASIEEPAKAAVCFELTLRRQLESQEFDGVDWAINAATLSQFFVTEKNFQAARRLLACATKVLDEHGSRNTRGGEDDEEDTLKRRKADIARCWAKYGHHLLTVSWNDLLNLSNELGNVSIDESEKGEGELEKIKEVDVGFSVSGLGNRDAHQMFESLSAGDIEKQVTAEKVLDFSQARLVFLHSQSWLNKAKEYYTLDDHASDCIRLTQEMSQLYKVLAYFEPQDDRRCKMHKRRIDMLEAVLVGVNPQYYMDFCRQIRFEVGETYSDIMDIKLTIQSESPSNVNPHTTLKISSLAGKAIDAFQAFVDTFKNDGELPAQLSEEFVRPVLLAHVFMGRLHSKFCPTNTRSTIERLQESLRNYKFVVDYCDRNPEAALAIQSELEVTREMANLLPMKIQRVACEELL